MSVRIAGLDGARCGRDFKPMFVSPGVTVGGSQHNRRCLPLKESLKSRYGIRILIRTSSVVRPGGKPFGKEILGR